MKTLKVLAAALATAALTACVHKTEAPALTGPSGSATSITIAASPDSISHDGGSQSRITVTVFGPDGRPLSRPPSLPIDTFVNGVQQDYGTLSARTVVPNSNGEVVVVYTAPPPPPGNLFGTCRLPGNREVAGTCIEIVATPLGTAFEGSTPQSVQIRLMPPGVIVAPGSTPTASFTVTPSAVVLNENVTFDASASLPGTGAQIVDYSWNFGDGTTGTGKIVAHTFRNVGVSQNVTLTITNDLGLSSSSTRVVAVGPGDPPKPAFTSSPKDPVVGQTVFFNAEQSTAGVGHTITSYRWTFGDGATASGVSVTHAYAVAGTYTMLLTVTDEAGQSVTSAATPVIVGRGNPTAVLSLIKTGGTSIQADGSASTAVGTSTIVLYTFIWGDGTQTESSNPVQLHTYAPPVAPALTTTFTVTLRVTDNATPARTGTAAQPITVP
jgi:PKD repeat protein